MSNKIQTCKCGCFVFDAECKKCVMCGADRENNPQEAPQVKSVEGILTFDQCKNKIAIGRAFKDWETLRTAAGYDYIIKRMDEASELYESQFKSRIAELEARIDELEYKLTSANVKNARYKKGLENICLKADWGNLKYNEPFKNIAEQTLNNK